MQEHSPSVYQKLAETDFHQKLHDVNPDTDSMIIGDVGVDMLNHAADQHCLKRLSITKALVHWFRVTGSER